MIIETVTYENYYGEKKTKDLYFHLTKPELVDLQVSETEGLDKYIKRISASESQKEIVEVFKKIVKMAYGVVSPDGDRFMKNQEVKDAFLESPAYEAVYMRLATDEKEAAKFINGIMPKDLDKPAISAIDATAGPKVVEN